MRKSRREAQEDIGRFDIPVYDGEPTCSETFLGVPRRKGRSGREIIRCETVVKVEYGFG